MSCEKEIGELILKQYGQFFKHQHEDLMSLFPDRRRDKSFPTLINIQGDVNENIRIYELIESDNNVINKILTSFCSLLLNVVKLKDEAFERHFTFLSLYGEYESAKHGSSLQFLCENMESICKLTSFVQRLQEVCKNICHQVFGMYSTGIINIDRVRLQYVINHIGDLFTILVTLDLLILNSRLPEHWEGYSKSVKQLSFNYEKYNISHTKLKSLLDLTKDVNMKIMHDKIFEDTLSKLATLRQTLAEKNCATIAVEFNQYLKNTISNLEKTSANVYESRYSHKWIAVNALFVFNNFIFGNTDKRMFKALVDINMKAHSVPVYGTAVWYPEQFMQRYLPSLYQSQIKLSQNLMKTRQSYVTNKKLSIFQDTHNAQLEVSKWVIAVEESFCKCNSQTTAHKMNLRAQLLMKGIDFASQINFLVHSLLNLHMSQGIPITKSVLMAIFQLFETLKSLINAYKRNFLAITSAANLISQHLVFQIISSIIGIKKTLMSDKNYAQQKLDELTALIIAERALRGPITLERRIIAHTALTLIPLLSYPEDSYIKLSSLIENNDKICNLFSQLQFLCNGSLLYWHKDTISVYLEQIFQNKLDNSRLRLIFNLFEDCSKMLVDNDRYFKTSASDMFDNEVLELINRHLLKPIGQQIETNLRLHTHSHLQLDSSNSFTNRIDSNKFLIQFSNVKLNRRFISPKCHIENYLSTIFYNLTTVVLYDWKTYGEMRQLANFKLHLDTVEDNLPTQTLEQGLDVLEIMRNIHIFVSKYMYNLNNQIFVEQSSNNKHLNSINIRHIANSIRTHGTGIMNTTVNFTYQFLRKKFYTFSQFMYDEHIKSRLIKDLKIFRENSQASENMYNYKNAEKFNKGIRNLGVTENGQSYLDLFRVLITHIGNAMGYVRMIRSGGRHCCSSATVFLPCLDNVLSFCELASRDDLSLMTKESANMLETTINTLTTNFTQGTEYFQLLVDVFSPVFRNPSNVHLKNFYVIIPPLTINFVENIILCKDRMTKKNKVGAAFTDDGFAMGLAYILKLLDQDSDFNSLHWFQSVWKHISNERKSVQVQREKGPTQLQQALALTDKKLTTLEEEFQLLYFSFSSARIFFQ